MRKWIVLLFYIMIVIPFTISNGKFYVGFLRYANRGNLKMDGTCCDGKIGADGKCHVTCDLLFQVSAFGLDNVNMTNKRPSRLPINDSNSFIFNEKFKDAINPITFDFKKWPGTVHLVVQVFDQDHDSVSSNNTLEAVDDMDFFVNLDEPSINFVYQNMTGNRLRKPSEIMLLFRYECGPTYYGVDCMTDCLMYPTSPVCPRTSTPRPSTSTQLPTEPLTPTTECTSTAAELTTSSTTESTERWTTTSATRTVPSTTPREATTETSTSDASSSASVLVTSTPSNSPEVSSRQQTDTTETFSQTSPSQTSTSTSEITERPTSPETTTQTTIDHASSSSSSGTTSSGTSMILNKSTTVRNTSPETEIPPSTTGRTSFTRHYDSTIGPTNIASSTTSETTSERKTNSFSTSSTTRTVNPKTTPSEPLSSSSERTRSSVSTGGVDSTSTIAQTTAGSPGKPTEYSHVITDDPNYDWAIIVGCVLAGLAIMALILFMVYRNRQKTLMKRQEIYNVSPEVMSVVEENGTTERSDVPITTSPL